jgi:hypothetical protein
MDLIVSLPLGLTNLVPGTWSFEAIPTGASVPNTISSFVPSTNTTDPATTDLLHRAAAAPLISYSDEFSAIFGNSPNITLVSDQAGNNFAFEAGPWDSSRNEFWFTSAIYNPPSQISILNLNTGEITRPNITTGYKNFQRGVYSAKKELVYFTTYRDNETYYGGLVSINPSTYEVKPIFNSYFGLPFSGLNDITVTPNADNQTSFFISDNNFPAYSYPTGLGPPQLSTGAYHYDTSSSQLLPAISQSTIPGLNAVKLTPDLKSLIVGATSDTGSEIYKFDLDENLRPTNQRLFAVPRFFLDGLQIDDQGRVWSVEGDGIVVRSEEGRILGVVNRSYFGRQEKGALQWANLGLCGNVLVVLAVDRIWTVKLAEIVVTADSKHVFG